VTTSRRRRISIWTLLVVGLLAAFATALTLRHLREKAFLADCDRLVTWVTANYPAAGTYPDIDLPAALSSLSETAKCDAVVLPDGRVIVLIQRSIGFKHNWSGVICTSAPLKPSEIGQDYYGRPLVEIDGLRDHVIFQQLDDTHYEVGFDLG
jgi:hypothetical protein